MIYAHPGATFEAVLSATTPGLAGILTAEIYDPTDGSSAYGPSAAGITEPRPGTYVVQLTAPATSDSYLIRWDDQAGKGAEEELVVSVAPPPGTPPPPSTLATVAQLRRYLHTSGTVVAGAQVDETLLEDLLGAASSRIIEQLPERTLIPDLDDAPPVEVRIPFVNARTIVQVPDLRELVSIDVQPAAIAGVELVDQPAPTALHGFTLVRRPRHVCALWLHLAAPVNGSELVINGRWGPADLRTGEPLEVNRAAREACLVWAARAYHNRTARYADSVQDPAGGVSNYFRNLPPDVASTIDALRVPGV